jgi:hypothetical protein
MNLELDGLGLVKCLTFDVLEDEYVTRDRENCF